MITHVGGEANPDLAAYNKQTKRDGLNVGDFVQLTVLRDGATSQVAVPADSNQSVTDHSYADVSLRRAGFPVVLIHDTIAGRRQCGGPVFDLEGQVVEVNIARFHRCSTFAIPQQRISHLVRVLLNKSHL